MDSEQEQQGRKGPAGPMVASHPEVEELPVLVGPSTSDEFNTIRSNLIPKACFMLEDSHFAFNSSFVEPFGLTFNAGPLKGLLDKHPGFKLSIFGHTDPVGKDDYNKVLSGRRAQAIYALLTRKPELWADLYYEHDLNGKDKWGVRSIQIMLNFAGPIKAGSPDGDPGPETRKALKDFEVKASVPAKGFNSKNEIARDTFNKLARLYMDRICLDDDGEPFQLTPEDFLARGKGKDGKGDYQGCGEFNPLMIFSAAEIKRFEKPGKKAERNKENQPNRRIMILLYHPESRVDPKKWPCPSVKEGIAGCILRFHSDFKERRKNLSERREHKEEKDDPDMVGTFACRFYDRQTNDSPCEGALSRAVRVVPNLFPTEGNVIAFAERLDGEKFFQTKSITLGVISVEIAFMGTNGRAYFLPPRAPAGKIGNLSVTDTGQTFRLETEVVYTDDPLSSMKGLRQQMRVLREFSAMRVALNKKEKLPESDNLSTFNSDLTDGHIRLARALEKINPPPRSQVRRDEVGSPNESADSPQVGSKASVDSEFRQFEEEHATEVDRLRATLPPQRGG